MLIILIRIGIDIVLLLDLKVTRLVTENSINSSIKAYFEFKY